MPSWRAQQAGLLFTPTLDTTGHCGIVRPAEQSPRLRARGIILGVFDDIHLDKDASSSSRTMFSCSTAMALPEALNAEERMMGMPRLADVVRCNAQRSAQAISNAIVDAYNQFTGDTQQSDDVTFFVVKREG